MAHALKRWGGLASLVAAGLWFLVWIHQQQAHGATQLNETNLVWGLTWMDSGKFLVLALLLVGVALASLIQHRLQPGKLGRTASMLTFASLGLLIIATTLEFWTFPWGSYAVTYEQATGLAGSNQMGGIQAVVSLVFTLSLIALCVDLVGAKVISIWVAIALVVGGLTTVFLSPVFWIPAAAWLVLGLVLLRKK